MARAELTIKLSEVKTIKAAMEELIAARDAATARAERAEAAEARVRALHVKGEDYQGRPYCEECASLCHSRSGLGCDDVDGAWPCPTIAALDAQRPAEGGPEGERRLAEINARHWAAQHPAPASLDGGQPDTPAPTEETP